MRERLNKHAIIFSTSYSLAGNSLVAMPGKQSWIQPVQFCSKCDPNRSTAVSFMQARTKLWCMHILPNNRICRRAISNFVQHNYNIRDRLAWAPPEKRISSGKWNGIVLRKALWCEWANRDEGCFSHLRVCSSGLDTVDSTQSFPVQMGISDRGASIWRWDDFQTQ